MRVIEKVDNLNRFVYAVKPRKLDMDLYDIVFVDNNKRASSKRFESEEECMKFIKKNARENNWVVSNTSEFISKKDKLTDYGKSVARGNKIDINEDTVKNSKGKWVNKGKEGTHGEFRTKKAADA